MINLNDFRKCLYNLKYSFSNFNFVKEKVDWYINWYNNERIFVKYQMSPINARSLWENKINFKKVNLYG
ncbi:MAG: hypothetical protein SPLM_08760 [Spiroplasma phoeniceum]